MIEVQNLTKRYGPHIRIVVVGNGGVFVIVIPLAILIAGLVVWLRRRHRAGWSLPRTTRTTWPCFVMGIRNSWWQRQR